MPKLPGHDSQNAPNAGANNVLTNDVVVTGIVTVMPSYRFFGSWSFEALGGCTPAEKHSLENKITSYPIETGGVISDHAYQEQRTLVLDVAVSDIDGAMTDIFSANASQPRSRNAWDALRDIANTFKEIDVQTGLELYKNMVITNMETTQDVKTSRALKVTITLKQVRHVTPQTVAFSGATSKGAGGVPGTQSTGNKPGTTLDKIASGNVSVLKAAMGT